MKPDVEEAIRLLTNIRWKSIDKDNMEFEARASCYQVDAIRTLLDAYASREVEVKEAVRAFTPLVGYLHIGDPRYDEGTVPVTGAEFRRAVAAWAALGGNPNAVDGDQRARALSTYVTNHEASDGK